jgi:type IV pilus assembly protein PilV
MHEQHTHSILQSRRRLGVRSPIGQSSRGFSLVEVLVSIIVLTFGLLGMVGMQAAALKSNREARLQSSAVVLARELAEMIRGNRVVGVLPTNTNPYIGSFTAGAFTSTAGVAAYCLSVGSTCASATPNASVIATANAEMTEWLERVNAELPGARVDVCYDSAPFDASGLPQWACTAGTAPSIIVVKIGWVRGSTDKSLTGVAAFERATIPSIVFPVTAGSAI